MNCDDVATELNTTYAKALAIMSLPGFPAVRIAKELHTTKELLNRWIKRHSGESFSYKVKPEKQFKQTNRHQNKGIKTQMRYVGGYEQ